MSAADPDRQQKIVSVTGVSLSVTLLAIQDPMEVRESAPMTTPPLNSTATRVVPVLTYKQDQGYRPRYALSMNYR